MKVAFVILHYWTIDVTIRCVESIKKVLLYDNYEIVIVDNGSENNTGKELKIRYETESNINVICLKENLGFSVGNNVGYCYAKEKLKVDYIFVINNDTEMIQSDFVQKAIQCYEEEHYYVLGPDIINLEGVHQSPQRNHVITKAEAIKWFVKRYIFSKYLYVHKMLRLPNDFCLLRKYFQYDKKRKRNLATRRKLSNVELQGACFIFSPLYVSCNQIAFEELTFMYGEEALLSLKCKNNGWKIFYNPELKIKHAERVATSVVNDNVIDKEIFWSENHVKAIREILKNFR